MNKISLLLLAAVGCASPMVYTHGVPNLIQVSPGLWRSGQPTRDGWKYLKSIGVVEVVKLNDVTEGSDQDAADLGLAVDYLTIVPEDDHPLSVLVPPDDVKIKTAVDIMTKAGPNHIVLVHCTHGQDRTGTVVGRYRVVHDGWLKSKAWGEMISNHFHPELPGLMAYWLDTP